MLSMISPLRTFNIRNQWWILSQTNVAGEFSTQMDQLRGIRPITKVEFISITGVVTDISTYYSAGGNISRTKDRLTSEIHAGDFDVTLFNHDDKFSEYVSTSLLYGAQYHGAKIRISQGFIYADGSEVYEAQCIGFIDELQTDSSSSLVTLRCRDIIRELMDRRIHVFPTTEVPTAGGSNVGNGVCSAIATKPFKTVNETWTLTCTLGGADGVATFSVVGSVSGNVGTATSGTEFSTGTGAGGIKFTLSAGSTVWVITTDVFTFSTKQYPEWSAVNPAKIIWSILTGYNYDTNVLENWSALVLDLSNEQSDANPDINYTSFVQAVADLTSTIPSFTGFAGYNRGANEVMEELMVLFFGAMYSDGDGRLRINTYAPRFANTYRNFGDTKKITSLGYNRSIDEVINYVTVHYKSKDVWEFSDVDVDYQGTYVAQDSASVTKYKKNGSTHNIAWYVLGGAHVVDFAAKLLDRFADPPLNIEFTTGLDGLRTEVGDRITVTDGKYGFDGVAGEVVQLSKHFDTEPRTTDIIMRRDSSITLNWGFLGSSADEADGISPQQLDFDDGAASDLLFAYAGTTADAAGALPMDVTFTAKALPQNSTPSWIRGTVSGLPTINVESVSAGQLNIDISGPGDISYGANAGAAASGYEFGFIGKFTNLVAAASFGANRFRIYWIKGAGPSIGPIDFFSDKIDGNAGIGTQLNNDPTVWACYRFVIKTNGTVDVYKDGVFYGNIGGGSGSGIGGNGNMAFNFRGTMTGTVEKWWYKTSAAGTLAVPNYVMF